MTNVYRELEKVGPLVSDLMQQESMDVLKYTTSMNPKGAFVLGMLMNRALSRTFNL